MTHLLERAPFVDQLDAALAEAAMGQGRLALIGGEAGIGKTVLVETFCEARSRTARVFVGACDALSTPRPLGPLVDIARQVGGDLARVLASGATRERLFDALLDELTRGARPTLLVIEDVHWADEATLDLLRFLARRLGHLRALVIATYRDDEIGPRHPLRLVLGDLATSSAVRRLALPPLSEGAVRTLAQASPLDAPALHRQTGGNPFFAAEVLATGEPGIPATVRDAILARTARLSASARAALDAAAVIGFRSEPWLLTELLGPGAVAIDDGVSAGVLRAETMGIAFRHDLTREAVLDAMSPHRRVALHRQVLDALRARVDEANGVDEADGLARLAHHAELAGDARAVLAYAPAAARRAAELKAHRESAAQYARALRWTPDRQPGVRAPLLEGLALQCYLTDRHLEAVDAWTEALAISREAGNPLKEGEILRWLSRPLWYLGRSPEADAMVLASLRVLEQQPPGIELGWTYSDLSRVRVNAGQNDAVMDWAEQALALAERFDDTGLLAHALNNLGCAKLNLGDACGSDVLARSLEVAQAANLEEHAGRAHANLASMEVGALHFAAAERWLEDGIAYTFDHDVETYYLCLRGWRAVQRFFQGRWSEAAEIAAAALLRPDLSPMNRVIPQVVLGRVRARRGDPEADVMLDAALATAGPTVDPWIRGLVRAARAEAAWLAGDGARSMTEARLAYAIALDLNDRRLADEVTRWMEPTAAAPGAPPDASEWAAAAANWQALGCPYEAAQALADSGDEAILRRALADFDRLGARPMVAVVARRLRELGVRGIPRGPRSATRANPAGLTARELEIVALLIAGRRNAEIAAGLFLSPKTVEHHIGSIFAKLDVHARSEVATAAARLGVPCALGQDRGTGPAR